MNYKTIVIPKKYKQSSIEQHYVVFPTVELEDKGIRLLLNRKYIYSFNDFLTNWDLDADVVSEHFFEDCFNLIINHVYEKRHYLPFEILNVNNINLISEISLQLMNGIIIHFAEDTLFGKEYKQSLPHLREYINSKWYTINVDHSSKKDVAFTINIK